MHKVYYPFPISDIMELSEEESKHLNRVLRISEGDEVLVMNGVGVVARAKVIDSHPKKTKLQIESRKEYPSRKDISLHIAMAPTKNIDRFENFLEKSTEIGIDHITPLLCERSERKVIKPERLQKVLVSAIKQSGQPFLPILREMTPFKEFVKNHPEGCIAFCENPEQSMPLLKAVKNHSDITILIGPEGDFSPEEVSFATMHGYKQITLGDSILRTETAGIFVCALINGIE